MEVVTLVSSGDRSPGVVSDQPCYRIPALTVTRTGRVLVAWDVRPDWKDLPGDFDIALRWSDDHGRTWSEPSLLRAHDTETYGKPAGYGDASFIVDPVTRRVFCHYVSSTGRSFFDAEAGPDGDGLRPIVSWSDDDGVTWQHRDITAEIKEATAEGIFASSGNGIALARGPYAGRLLQPYVIRRGKDRYSAVAYSDDHGDTWRMGRWVGPDCDENKLVERASGDVLMMSRARPRRKVAVSLDGGVTFDTPRPHDTLVEPACNGGAWRLADGILVASLLDDPEDRRRLVLRTSADDGATWSSAVVVDPGACGYSVVAELSDGSIGRSDGSIGRSDGSIGRSDGSIGGSDGSIGGCDGSIDGSDGSIGGSDGSIGGSDGSIGGSDGSIGLVYEAGDYHRIDFCRISRSELQFGEDGTQVLVPVDPTPGAAKPPVAGPSPGA
jgi:sialidase-1